MSFNLISSGKAVFLSLTFLSTFVLSTPAYAAEETKNAPALTRVKGTKVLMETPEGFTQAPSFNGYVLKEKSASIMVTEMPAPVDKLFEGFTKENLAKKRMELVSREEVEVAGRKGILLHVKQPLASLMFEKWITVFGDEDHAVLVMAVYPEQFSEALSSKMKSCVSNVDWKENLKVSETENLNFEVTPKKPFKLAHRLQNSLLFTSEGHFPAKDASDPLYVVAESIGSPLIPDKKEFCLNRVKQAATLENVKETSVNEVKIDGLAGFEVIADAIDKNSSEKVFIYQVVLFGEKSYFLHQGLAAEGDREKYVPIFKAMSETFKVK